MKIRIVHIINSLEFGGAEMMLCNLLARSDRGRFEPTVVLLIDDLTLADRVEALGVPIRVVGMKPGIPDPRGVARLASMLRREAAEVVQTWMDHSNLIGGLATRVGLGSDVPLVWGIHHSHHVPGIAKRTTLLAVAACARLSRRLPTRVVCCSEDSRRSYEARGFDAGKVVVIPNGFDTDAFRPNPTARDDLRRELGLAPETPLIGLIARHDPFKDHDNFLRAAGRLVELRPDVHFALCGDKVDPNNRSLTGSIATLGLDRHCHLMGPRRDVPRVLAGLDLAASSSLSEAFPLAVGEAMACGIPCVVTDVGDSALMVGETGLVVPPRDPEALALAFHEVLSLDPATRRRRGLDARRRTQEHFDLGVVTQRYEDLYDDLLARRRVAATAAPTAGRVSLDEVTTS